MKAFCVGMMFAGLAVAQTPDPGAPDAAFRYRGSGYGFVGAGGTVIEGGQPGFKGGGFGGEAFLWKGLAASADVSILSEDYLRARRTFGHAGVQAAYHWGNLKKVRGVDPFVLFGVGGFFPDEKRAGVHGGAGATYWFKRHVGVRFEFRVGERTINDDIVSVARIGVAFR
jgi:hypothetical protein